MNIVLLGGQPNDMSVRQASVFMKREFEQMGKNVQIMYIDGLLKCIYKDIAGYENTPNDTTWYNELCEMEKTIMCYDNELIAKFITHMINIFCTDKDVLIIPDFKYKIQNYCLSMEHTVYTVGVVKEAAYNKHIMVGDLGEFGFDTFITHSNNYDSLKSQVEQLTNAYAHVMVWKKDWE